MAVQDCDKISNILATSLLAWDDDLSLELAKIVRDKKVLGSRVKNLEWLEGTDEISKHLNNEYASANIKIRAAVQAKLLAWEFSWTLQSATALAELTRQLKNTWWNITEAINLLETLKKANPSDYWEIAKALWYSETEAKQAIQDINEQLSEYIASEKTIYDYNKLDWEISKLSDIALETASDDVKKMVQDAIWEAKEKVKEWKNPSWFSRLDEEWAVIKDTFTDEKWVLDVEWAMEAWENYIVWRALLSEWFRDDNVFKAIVSWLKNKNTLGKLTQDEIYKIVDAWDLDLLLSKAYTNTKDLVEDAVLREYYKEALISLSSMKRIDMDNIGLVKSLVNTMAFAKQWASFSSIAKYDQVLREAKSLWLDVSKTDWEKLYDAIKDFWRKLKKDDKGNFIIPQEITIDWVRMQPEQVVELISTITNDRNIIKLLNMWEWDWVTTLWVATEYLLWKDWEWAKKIIALFNKAKKPSSISQSRDIALKTITGKDIKEWSKIWYYNFREKLYQKQELWRERADFQQKLADANKMRIQGNWDIKNIAWESPEAIADQLDKNIWAWWYLIVNDVKWWDYEPLRKALWIVNEKYWYDNKITVLFPRWATGWNFTLEWGDIIYKTVDSDMYDELAWKISIMSLWEAIPTREINASMVESVTGRNQDKLRYQPSYNKWVKDNLWRQVSDQQVEYWFVKDDNWNIKTFYHRTPYEFDEFNLDHFRTWSGDSLIPGFYFADQSKSKIITNPNKANRLIEVYLKVDNPLDVGTWITEIFTLSDLTKLIKEYNSSIWRIYDERRRAYKLRERIDKDISMEWFFHNIEWYEEIFWNQKDFMSFFKWYTWIDWIRDIDGWVMIVFEPNQIKYIDNRLPTFDADMRYMEKSDRKYVYDMANIENFNNILTDYLKEGFDEVKINKLFWLDKWESFIFNVDLHQSLKRYPDEFFDNVNKLSDEEFVILMNKISSLSDFFELAKSNWKSISWISGRDLDYYVDWLRYFYKNLVHQRNGNWVELSGLKGSNINDFINNNQKLTIESTILDIDWEIVSADLWLWWNTKPITDFSQFSDDQLEKMTFWHNHPLQTLFSGPDLSTFKLMQWERWPKYIWLILPWWVWIKLPNTKEVTEALRNIEEYSIIQSIDVLNKLMKDNWVLDLQLWWKYSDVIDDINNWVKFQDYFNDLFNAYSSINDDLYKYYVDELWLEDPLNFMEHFSQYSKQADVSPTNAMKVKMFGKDRTWEEIADEYKIPVEIIHDTDMIEWVKAYWAYWRWVIYFTDMIKESTAPHELFHAVFNMYVDNKTYYNILEQSKKLFWYSDREAEEELADAFAQYYLTWKFDYADISKLSKKEQKTFFEKVKQFFEEIKKWLDWVDAHRADVEQLFKDIWDMKYLPDDGKTINKIDASNKYNKEIEDAAYKYFWDMLWVQETNDKLYREKVENLLEEKTWIAIKDIRNIKNQSKIWNMVDDEFMIDTLTAWRFDKEIVNVPRVINEIKALDHEQLAKVIKWELWDFVSEEWILKNWNIEHIRETFIDMKTAWDEVSYLQAKGKIISLVNWWNAQTMTKDDIVNMFSNQTQFDVYKQMFFPNQTLTDEEWMKLVRQINSDVFDIMAIWLSNNLIKAWYNMPLVSVREAVYEYLTWNLDNNSQFAKAFLAKNKEVKWLDNYRSIIDRFMPNEIKFDYEDSMFKVRWLNELSEEAWLKSVFKEIDNPFIQDSYSTLAAIANVKAWRVSQWNEKKILVDILDNYINKCLEWLDWWVTFREAEQLKLQVWYALDMFEQDFLIPRYWKFLTTEERQWLMWMKYQLPIAVSWQSKEVVSKELNQVKDRLLKNYDKTLKDKAWAMEINSAVINRIKNPTKKQEAMIAQREKQLMDNWEIIVKQWNDYIVVDTRKAIRDNLNNLPKDIEWFENIKALWYEWLNDFTNEQAYWILKAIEFAKNRNSLANLPMDIVYKLKPQLAAYDFFRSYKPVDWLPRALVWNALQSNPILKWLDNTSNLDRTIKLEIFWKIKRAFIDKWHIEAKDLEKFIKDSIDNNIIELKITSKSDKEEVKKAMQWMYEKSFVPYVYLSDLPIQTKDRISTLLAEQKNGLDKAFSYLPPEYTQMLDNVVVVTKDWERMSVNDLKNADINDWYKRMFDNESVFLKWADDVWYDTPSRFKNKTLSESQLWDLKRDEEEYRKSVVNEYNDAMQAVMNNTQIITDSERKLMSAVMRNARSSMRKFTLTQKLLDAADSVTWLNEEVARDLKNYVIWFWAWASFWTWDKEWVVDRWQLVKDAYRNYYQLDLEAIWKIKPANKAESLAIKLAKYFKQVERQLWSLDWVQWCTTDAATNIAFYHIWEAVLNVQNEKWIFWLLSWVQNNEFFKIFKFTPDNWQYRDAAKKFIRAWKWVNETWIVWWYRDYVDKIQWLTRDEFNTLFWSNFSDSEFKIILQGMTWFTLTWSYWRNWQKFLNILNSSWWWFRLMMSYPWQLLTIPQQSVAYFLKQVWFEKQLWMESMWEVDWVRDKFNVLNWAYTEINMPRRRSVNPDSVDPTDYYNRYWVPDVDRIYRETSMYTTDDVVSMYAKIDDYASSQYSNFWFWREQLDPYKDNANNIIDWLFARNFKNIAFSKALRENNVMQFATAKEFNQFMENPTISRELKQRLMDAVNTSAGRNFRNILWLWFGWVDRAIWGSTFWNIMYWLMQMMNFRWSWWQNIFRDTWDALMSLWKYAKQNPLSKAWKDKFAKYMAMTPEFRNLIWALFNDLVWTWKLQRFQDNWRWTEEDWDYTMSDYLDFIEYMWETLNMTSQWWQGINSFWPVRPLIEAERSSWNSLRNPTVYKDTWWVWALVNNIWKNMWRNWKPANWVAKMWWVLTTYWPEAAWAYVQNEFWKLSFGSLRYMMDEDVSNYWFTYETSTDTERWIPWIIMWESSAWDKTFSYELSNTETWSAIKQIFLSDTDMKTRFAYAWNIWEWLANTSQLFSIPKNIKKAIGRYAASPYTMDDFADLADKTLAWKEFWETGRVTPRNWEERKIFINTILDHWQYRPWSSSFNKSMMNYDTTWHMDWKTWDDADAEMEFLLEHIKYQVNSDWTFKHDRNWEKIIDPNWTAHMANIKQYYYNQTYTTQANYDYIKNWIDNHNEDPNYRLYIKLLWEWAATNYIDKAADNYMNILNRGKKWADNKWTAKELKESWIYYWEFMDYLTKVDINWLWNIFDALQVLDQDAAIQAWIWIISHELTDEKDQKALRNFFKFDKEGNPTGLSTQYQTQLRQIWAMGRALDEGNIERFIWEASSLTHIYMKDDPTWVVALTAIDSIKNRVLQQDNLSDEQKLESVTALFHSFHDVLIEHWEEAKKIMWEDYDKYLGYVNDILYQWDWDTISALRGSEMKNSSWWRSKAAKLSSNIKDLIWKMWGNPGSRWTGSTQNKNFATFKIWWADLVKALWLKWASSSNPKISIKWYDPNINLWPKKDVTRESKWLWTQEIKKKKQILS